MGNYLKGEDKTPTEETKVVVRQIKRFTKIPKLLEILSDFYADPRDQMCWERFDLIMSPMLNNPLPLFNLLQDSVQMVNFYEAFIIMVLFCKEADYEERLQLVFNSFDVDGGGALDRRELSHFINSAIYGLCKIVGIKIPSKHTISTFISDQFMLVDEDGSGSIEYEEFEKWINDSMEI